MNLTQQRQNTPIRIWVICEGRNEKDGALENLIRRIARDVDGIELEFELWRNPRGVRRRFRVSTKGDGIFKKFVATLFDAQALGFDAVICLVDRDQDKTRVQSIGRAQDVQEVGLPRAFGCAVESFDAWFLADEKALSKVLQSIVPTQPNPESERDPKSNIKRLRDEANSSLSLSECYRKVAEVVDLECLSSRCPKGFGVWKTRVESIFD